MEPQDDMVNDEQENFIRNPTECNDQPRQNADEGSLQRRYPVNHTVEKVGNGRQRD